MQIFYRLIANYPILISMQCPKGQIKPNRTSWVISRLPFTIAEALNRLAEILAAIESFPNVSVSQRLWTAVDAPPHSNFSIGNLD